MRYFQIGFNPLLTVFEETDKMEISNCSKSDFHKIIENITDFWGSDRTLHLHYPILIYEFGYSAFVIKDGENSMLLLFWI